ncbi:hypothetical protein CBR_g50707 [Chara braunii]|uniref:C2 domain-containing protein n=1 Tax=Chara braunii TaxID=69332 RepID=A0A388K5K6_CHABU|nr:hypothetical protein CBR_g50707 [Chara braunii]|eukprot:GBG65344.1 hypothetical protein CBR_g50707 [Chara braunii]
MGGCFSTVRDTAPAGLKRQLSIDKNEAQEATCFLRAQDSKVTLIDLSISASGIVNLDTFSKSDPIAVLREKQVNGAWREVGRTEVIANTTEPRFVKMIRIIYMFSRVQVLQIQLYDVDTDISDQQSTNELCLQEQDYIGEMEFCVSELFEKGLSLTKPIQNKRFPRRAKGTITVSRQTQCHVRDSATSAVPGQQCHVRHSATSDTVPRQQCPDTMTGAALGMSGQLANESIADYKKRFQAQLAAIEAEEQRQLAVKAAQLQAEEAATAEKLRLQAEADADTQARRKEAQDLLLRHEANSIDRLKFWHFEPNGDEPTPEEKHKEFMAKLVTRLVYTCNHLQSELANLQWAVRNHKTQHEDATRALDAPVLDLEQAVPGPAAGASSSASSSRQLEERVDHVVAMLGDISAFTEPATISQRFDSARPYKMPTFRIEKFDDYTHQDLVVWWQGFTTELGIHEVPDHLVISALFINTKGGCQIWLNHMATIHGVQVSDLHKKVSWADMAKEWKKRFIVDDAPALAINRIFTMAQGSTPTRDWLTDWQKIVATPDLDLPFPHLRREFYNRSCAALSLALGDREQYHTFAKIINKAREIIKTNRSAAHEKSTWQPTYVEKARTGPRQQHFAAVQQDSGDNPAATPASSDGDQVAVVHPRSNNKSRNNGKAKSASQAGNGQLVQVPWVKFGLTEAEYKVRDRYGSCYWCNNTKHKTSLCHDQGKEDIITGRPSSFHVSYQISRMAQNFLTFMETAADYMCGHQVSPEDVNGQNDTVKLRLRAEGLTKRDFFYDADPFMVISRMSEDNVYTPVFKTEVARKTVSPAWNEIVVSVQQICNGDFIRPLKLECFDWFTNGSHSLIGECVCSMQELKDKFERREPIVLMHPASRGGASGRLHVDRYTIEPYHSFLDYVTALMEEAPKAPAPPPQQLME